ncbi:hypothetical protein P6O13_001723 [Klebsiella aerogenes]|nr:hypothetical protein [Klebsiella aerogenes]
MNNELTAALLTIEKCRELSGCPAGVDLQDWVKMLVSELSVVEEIHNSAVFITDELYDASPKEVQNIVRSLACMKMPAYACLVAGIKADGVALAKSAFEKHIQSTYCYQDEMVGMESALSIACQVESQLREGADK